MATIYLLTAPILFLLPVVIWYWLDKLLRAGGMMYGRVTLLYVLTLICLTVQKKSPYHDKYEADAATSLAILILLGCTEIAFALATWVGPIKKQALWLQYFVGKWLPILSLILAIPVMILADHRHWGETSLYALALSANASSICYNYRIGNIANIMMILLALGCLVFIFILIAMSDFTLRL